MILSFASVNNVNSTFSVLSIFKWSSRFLVTYRLLQPIAYSPSTIAFTPCCTLKAMPTTCTLRQLCIRSAGDSCSLKKARQILSEFGLRFMPFSPFLYFSWLSPSLLEMSLHTTTANKLGFWLLTCLESHCRFLWSLLAGFIRSFKPKKFKVIFLLIKGMVQKNTKNPLPEVWKWIIINIFCQFFRFVRSFIYQLSPYNCSFSAVINLLTKSYTTN